MTTAHLHPIDLFEVKVRQPVDSVEPPEGELSHRVAVQLNGQVLQGAHRRQSVDLLKAMDVGVGKDQCLEKSFNILIERKI